MALIEKVENFSRLKVQYESIITSGSYRNKKRTNSVTLTKIYRIDQGDVGPLISSHLKVNKSWK